MKAFASASACRFCVDGSDCAIKFFTGLNHLAMGKSLAKAEALGRRVALEGMRRVPSQFGVESVEDATRHDQERE